jgi:hypothetical protein
MSFAISSTPQNSISGLFYQEFNKFCVPHKYPSFIQLTSLLDNPFGVPKLLRSRF